MSKEDLQKELEKVRNERDIANKKLEKALEISKTLRKIIEQSA